MAARTKAARKTTTDQEFFEEDVMGPDYAKLYDLELTINKSDAYDVQVVTVESDAEQHILDQFHQQYVAVEGRNALNQLVNTRSGDMGTNTAFVMAALAENIEQIEANVRLRRLGKSLVNFNNKMFDHTGRQCMQTNAIAARTMQEDMRRDVYKPPPAPPRRRRKGAIPVVVEWLFGEKE